MPVKVSVVVPVWNPGPYIEPCIASVLGQSMPTDDYEVIFVDDGSTDATPARLDALAAERPNVRVIHIPNSGWPGRPRNVGIEEAQGEYIQFVDQDDRLAPEALERLHAMGARNGSDIVIGKVTSDFRGVPTGLFRRDRESCTIFNAPLIDSLTPHKMFRRAFLLEKAITFPEGRRRLEDQLFMVKTYFAGALVSVLGTYPCYFYMRRADLGHAGMAPIDPPTYYANLREVLNVVASRTTAGPSRNGMLRRFYRTEMLGRLSNQWYLAQEPAFQDVLFREIKDVAIERMSDDVEAGLPALLRIRARLLRSGDSEAMLALARRTSAIGATMRLEAIGWVGGRLELTFAADFVGGGRNRPSVELLLKDDRCFLHPDLTGDTGPDLEDVTDDVKKVRATVSVRDRATDVEWLVRTTSTTRLESSGYASEPNRVRLAIEGVAAIEAATAAGGQSLGLGTWDVRVRAAAFGLDRRTGLGIHGPARADAVVPAMVGDPARLVVATLGGEGLALEVSGLDGLHDFLIGRPVRALASDGRSLAIALPIAANERTERILTWLVLESERGERQWPAQLIGLDGQLVVVARFGIVRRRLAPGAYRLSLRLDGDRPTLALGTIRSGRDTRVYVDGAHRISVVSSAVTSTKRSIRAAARRLPAPIKSRLRRLVNRGGGSPGRPD